MIEAGELVVYNGAHNGAHNGAYNGAHNGAYNGAHNGAYNGALNGAYNGVHNDAYNRDDGNDFHEEVGDFSLNSFGEMQASVLEIYNDYKVGQKSAKILDDVDMSRECRKVKRGNISPSYHIS